MKKPSVWLVLAILLGLAPLIHLALVWPQLPAQVPVHFNIRGEADRMGSAATLWGLAALPLASLAFMLVLPRIDPKRQLDAHNANFQKMLLALMASLAAFGVMITRAAQVGYVAGNWVSLILSGMYVLLGNYMVAVPPNYFAGIRTPWTLENPVVWQRTHRVGGRAMVGAGLLGLLVSWLLPGPATTSVVLGVLMAVPLGAAVYSYVVWRQLRAGQPA
ncbi:DUF1648 domain-containing protein [Hymenobacter gummosus]|uniref:DUF1648 domain-containing protein n=1 Tax=Hymenobacter gummosus TaxID=1776032 RepID=A0A431TUX0_9BACT|nr:SdpI family protein [Hymenobacter gummosus]RTQ44949.1 DUF1648 domain-containing protein [Hymenobacter gummosus]